MIFVTVGTHEQQFNRLIAAVDAIAKENAVSEPFFIQSGYCTEQPQYCDYKDFLSFEEMNRKMDEAHIIISHGGPSTFMMALERKKIPIVVPRQLDYDEHVNNHQVEFTKTVALEKKNIIPVYDMEHLEQTILQYDSLVQRMDVSVTLNNSKFTSNLEDLMWKLLK